MEDTGASNEGRGGLRGLRRVALAFAVFAVIIAPKATESAIANGDTRTLSLSNDHTNESGAFTYMVNGAYDMQVLEKLNWFLRDWRLNESIKMDPKLFDILWEVYRESGSAQPIDVLSGYRSPQTNAMLRRRSRAVAEHSQHMEGRAIDAHFMDVGPAAIRDIAMRMQAGGVGFYPVGVTWVHIDCGAVRYWPRMNREALTRLFPDGKTVFLPTDGQPMPGYDLARAEIEARGGDVVPAGGGGGLFAWLFGGPHGGGSDDAEESGDGAATIVAGGPRGRNGGGYVAVAEARNATPAASAPSEPGDSAPASSASAQTTVADVDAETSAPSDDAVTLRGPVAAAFIAPLPPRKPEELADVALAYAPVPPIRPSEFASAASAGTSSPFAVASSGSRPVDPPPRPPEFVGPRVPPDSIQDNRDLILALLKKGGAPNVITRGIRTPPHEALALTETYLPESAERSEMIARAAALAAPLPPNRPKDLTVIGSIGHVPHVARTASAPDSAELRKARTNPYGALAPVAFDNAPSGVETLLKAKVRISDP